MMLDSLDFRLYQVTQRYIVDVVGMWTGVSNFSLVRILIVIIFLFIGFFSLLVIQAIEESGDRSGYLTVALLNLINLVILGLVYYINKKNEKLYYSYAKQGKQYSGMNERLQSLIRLLFFFMSLNKSLISYKIIGIALSIVWGAFAGSSYELIFHCILLALSAICVFGILCWPLVLHISACTPWEPPPSGEMSLT